MSAIEHFRMLDAKNGVKDKEKLDEWDTGEKEDWEEAQLPGAFGKGHSTYSALSKRLATGDWGSKKASSLKSFK